MIREEWKHGNRGVSVIICCYNSAERIGATLSALAAQEFQTILDWEIILVDNASTDLTAGIADSIWTSLQTGIDLRIVYEGEPGLGNARNAGIREARYSVLLFCDDDNWLSPGYVQGVFRALDGDRNLAACGGRGIPVFETGKPEWFDEYAEAFAVGSQELNTEDGRLLNLYGAGLAVRKEALDRLYLTGFMALMKGRTGSQLSSSEDTELTYAFVLMGYRLQYLPELSFSHYLPAARLRFDYLKRIFTAFGADGPVRNLYYAHISHRCSHKRIRNWSWHLALALFRVCKYALFPPKKRGRVIYFRWNKAYIRQLFALRGEYPQILANIAVVSEISGIS